MNVFSSSLELTAATVVELSRRLDLGIYRPGWTSHFQWLSRPYTWPGVGSQPSPVLIWHWLAQPSCIIESYCINPCSYLASCTSLFLPEPIAASTPHSFLSSIVCIQLTGLYKTALQRLHGILFTICQKYSADDLLPSCKTGRQAPK